MPDQVKYSTCVKHYICIGKDKDAAFGFLNNVIHYILLPPPFLKIPEAKIWMIRQISAYDLSSTVIRTIRADKHLQLIIRIIAGKDAFDLFSYNLLFIES